ncbi:MAG: peptidase m23 [Candidatus Berkelbacteria bacterium Licking1014_7]|uniref:Peptidase m23 n=1 Tax=Candidatus Berkelbacteria bacterium Licking1014_7 TaxID=2017147 RepID=A0A554LI35_9BACT|nr:MAG: peptidase m23 [Candidatus Berkelbacteria bacterium Licking1014_7]
MKKIISLIFIVLIIGAGIYYWDYSKKNRPIPSNAVNMEYPLKDGSFTVIQSGKFGDVHTAPIEQYAMDIIKDGGIKSWFQFRKAGLESNASFGTPVYSPCFGNVKSVTNDFPDILIGIEGKPSEANRVQIGCNGFNVLLVHFKKGSIAVKEGETVQIGQKVAEIGNSGRSAEPHLHIHVFKTNIATDTKIPLPITFNGKYFFRGDGFEN